jgi:ribosomal-protein-alanine N-acetyltransferase
LDREEKLEQGVTIRQFRKSDMERVREIEGASMEYLTPLSLLSRYYPIPPEGFLVAELNRSAVGFIVGNLDTGRNHLKEAHVLSLAVDPAYRRLGIGATLVGTFIDRFKRHEIIRVRLEVKVRNVNAREFYRKLGFVEHQIIRGYYRMRGYLEDAVLFLKDVAPEDLES